MKQSYNNILDNNLKTMTNANRDYINQEINRLASPEQRSTKFRRSGTGEFGARQMIDFNGGSEYATFGVSMSSTKVSA